MWPLYALGVYVFGKWLAKKPKAKPQQDRTERVLSWLPLVRHYASLHRWPTAVDPVAFALATIDPESGGLPHLISRPNKNGSRDWGLFQNNDRYFAERGLTRATALDPKESTRVAMNLIADLAAKYNGNVSMMASAYNAGHYTTSNAAYQQRALSLYQKYKGLT